MCSKPGNGSP
jgi:hypothetical protein